jgi:hypothetical protein
MRAIKGIMNKLELDTDMYEVCVKGIVIWLSNEAAMAAGAKCSK